MVVKADDLVIVEWDDAWSHDGWMGTEEALEESKNKAKVISVGFVISKTKDSIALAQGRGLHRDQIGYAGIFNIPNGMIKKITKVKYK